MPVTPFFGLGANTQAAPSTPLNDPTLTPPVVPPVPRTGSRLPPNGLPPVSGMPPFATTGLRPVGTIDPSSGIPFAPWGTTANPETQGQFATDNANAGWQGTGPLTQAQYDSAIAYINGLSATDPDAATHAEAWDPRLRQAYGLQQAGGFTAGTAAEDAGQAALAAPRDANGRLLAADGTIAPGQGVNPDGSMTNDQLYDYNSNGSLSDAIATANGQTVAAHPPANTQPHAPVADPLPYWGTGYGQHQEDPSSWIQSTMTMDPNGPYLADGSPNPYYGGPNSFSYRSDPFSDFTSWNSSQPQGPNNWDPFPQFATPFTTQTAPTNWGPVTYSRRSIGNTAADGGPR